MATEAQIKITIDSKQANQSVEKLQADLKATRTELDRVIKTYGENSKQADALRKSVAGLEVEMGKLGIATDEAVNSQSSLKAQLRQLTNELATLEPGSARFQELSTRAGELRDRIQDANQAVNALAGNTTQKLGKALGSVAQIGVAGFQAVYSSMTLLGFEGEDLQKTMGTLMAVMNLSQAITTLGDIPDAFGNIKTAVLGLIPSFAGATTASGVLAAAMNAIPFVALATAIGMAVVGLMNYAQSAKDAKKIDEERKKLLAEKKKKQDEENKSVIEGAKDYLTMAYNLKASNAGSKERTQLINEINSKYGTTLKNMSDEVAFQKQLNTSIRDYIALSYNRFKLEKNQQYIDYNQQKRLDAEKEFNKNRLHAQEMFFAKGIAWSNDMATNVANASRAMYDFDAAAFKESFNKLKEIDGAIENLFDRRGQLIEQGEKFADQFKTPEGDGKIPEKVDETDKYAAVLEKARYQLERLAMFQEALNETDKDRITNVLQREEQAIKDKYGDKTKQLIEKGLEEQLQLEEERFKKEGKTVEDWKKKEAEIRKTADEQIKTNTVGIFTQAELDILKKLEDYRQQDIDNLKKTYSDKEQIILKQTEQININTRLAELEFNKSNELDDIDRLQITEEKKSKKKIEIRKKYNEQEIELLKQQANKEKEILDLQLQQTLNDTSKTSAEKEQAQADYNSKVRNLQMKLVKDINDINKGVTEIVPTKEEEQEKKLKKIQQYADKIAEIWGQLSDVIGNAADERAKREEAALQESFDNEMALNEERFKNRIITEEQYQYEKDRLETERAAKETELKKKTFEQQKRLQLINATIQGSQAVLAAYASGAATPLLGPATAAIYAAIAGAFAAVQIGQIANQQFTAASGGIVPGNGSGDVDSVPSLLAPGEFVINSKSASMYPNLLSNINEAGGGKKLVPDLPPVSNSQQTPNIFMNGNMGNNQPIKAYVVETDISESQRRINRIKQSVEF